MKSFFNFCVATFCLLNVASKADSVASKPSNLPTPTPYAITSRDANSRVWERTVYELGPNGQSVPKKHSYTELASGLNHLVNGKWVESKEEIEVLPNGTAAAVNGQHQAYFPGDIYNGQIEVVTPDGKHLKSRPLGLSYDDGTHTVLIAELTNSIGIVVGSNQVVYPDAFTDFKADLRYTYTKAGFEQDVILREQPPTPESLGLNPDTARLQLLTEFFDPPQPSARTASLPKQAGISLTDENLNFGTMSMIPGRAFMLGASAHAGGVMVGKSWQTLEGRQFLVEEVPVNALADDLAILPLPQGVSTTTPNKTQHTASRNLRLPTQHLAKADSSGRFRPMVEATIPKGGLVLDYQTISGALTNFTFLGDDTYYISGALNLWGTNTFEGGTVLKYATGASIVLVPSVPGTFRWQTSAYRPAVFTAKDDNSVGGTISGSAGSPSGYYANPALDFPSVGSQSVTGIRIAYAQQAIYAPGTTLTLTNAQIVNCQNGLALISSPGHLRNVLFSGVRTNFNGLIGVTIDAQNATFNNIACFATTNFTTSTILLTNCIVANVTNYVLDFSSQLKGDHNGFYNNLEFGTNPSTNTSYPFQTVIGGDYYLTNGCAFRAAGTTNIDPTLLAELRQKTTCAPTNIYQNTTISTATTFGPRTPRDTTPNPDLGYHYDPLDYIFANTQVNSNIVFTAGTAAGWYRTTSGWFEAGDGIHLMDHVTATFAGTATSPAYWVRCNVVQEQDNSGGYGPGGLTSWGSSPSTYMAYINATFTRCSTMADDDNQFRDDGCCGSGRLTVTANNCEFSGTGVSGYGLALNFTNCLFDRAFVGVQNDSSLSALTLQNCTFYGNDGEDVYVQHSSGATWPVYIANCAFENCNFVMDTNNTYCDYNAFLTNEDRPPVLGAHDVANLPSFNWQSSWLGNSYLPTSSPLIDAGNTTADQVGLYHFTTQTNQAKEANSIVDIGYHYVATDAFGNPLDSNGDGIPDYLEDANGNGTYDAGDLNNWLISPFNGLTTADGLLVFTPLK